MTVQHVDALTLVDALPLQRGLAELAGELRAHRAVAATPPGDALAALFEAELRIGLEHADAERAYEAAAALRRRTGDLARCHRTIARVLDAVGRAWLGGTCSIATEHRVTATAAHVVARLRPGTTVTREGRVLLAVPPQDQHLLALDSLAHLLADAGHPVDVVGQLPVAELAEAATTASAVVVSAHVTTTALPALVARLREAAPHALIVLGGPAARPCPGADLVTQDIGVLLRTLDRGSCPLSDREREVLQCVADGLTNAEAADVLGVAPGTLKTHLDHVFDKTGASGRAAAVATGLRCGWIQ